MARPAGRGERCADRAAAAALDSGPTIRRNSTEPGLPSRTESLPAIFQRDVRRSRAVIHTSRRAASRPAADIDAEIGGGCDQSGAGAGRARRDVRRGGWRAPRSPAQRSWKSPMARDLPAAAAKVAWPHSAHADAADRTRHVVEIAFQHGHAREQAIAVGRQVRTVSKPPDVGFDFVLRAASWPALVVSASGRLPRGAAGIRARRQHGDQKRAIAAEPQILAGPGRAGRAARRHVEHCSGHFSGIRAARFHPRTNQKGNASRIGSYLLRSRPSDRSSFPHRPARL